MQQGTRKAAHQEGSVQPKADKSSSTSSILKEIRKLRFGFPAAPEQSVAARRNCFTAISRKRQRVQKGSFSQLRFSYQFVCNYQLISNPYCYTPPEEQHHRRARRRDVALMLFIKHSDLAENQRKERSMERQSLHGHEKLKASSSMQQDSSRDAAGFLPAGRRGW